MVSIISLRNNSMMKVFNLIILFMIGCSSKPDRDGYDSAIEFFNKQKDGIVLLNFFGYEIYRHRGSGGFYLYVADDSKKMMFTFIDNQNATVEFFRPELDSVDISKFAKTHNMTEDSARKEVLRLGSTFIQLFRSLNVMKIDGINKAGNFISISITSTDELLYVPDTSKVGDRFYKWLKDTTYYKVELSRKLDEHWYYSKRKYPLEFE